MTLVRLFSFSFLSVKVDQRKVSCFSHGDPLFRLMTEPPGWEAFIRFHRLKQCSLMCLYIKKKRDRVSARCTRVARVPS